MFVFIDSAVTGCNIAMADKANVLTIHQEPITRGHAEFIIPQYQKMMGECDKKSEDIDSVIVTVGPGSFTGLRVGITMAQAIGKTVHGITSFQTFSCGVSSNQNRMVVVDTKRDDYYVQILDANHKAITDAVCVMPDKILNMVQEGTIVTGDAVTKLSKTIDLGSLEAMQQDMIDLPRVTDALMKGQLEFTKAEAFYIRDADVSMPKASKR
jgi:tRNA threonylcarbamoyladenosine biosynthesis protein TsaB